MAPRQNYKRGYPVAVLVGIEESQAALWKVFSNVVKPGGTLSIGGARGDVKALYNFHEQLVNELRPAMKEGVKSIILSSSPRTNFSDKFLEHIRAHHSWLMQGPSKAVFSQLTGSALTIPQVTVLTRNSAFSKIVGETTDEETENLIDLLEKRLNSTGPEPLVLYSIEEIEDHILATWKPGKPKPDYLLLTDIYLSGSRQRGRLQRLMAVAANREVKTRIVKADSPSGKRLSQLGGFVCLQKVD